MELFKKRLLESLGYAILTVILVTAFSLVILPIWLIGLFIEGGAEFVIILFSFGGFTYLLGTYIYWLFIEPFKRRCE